MITTLDIIKDDKDHFMPLGSIPVVGRSTHVSTVLRYMHEQKTQGVLVRTGRTDFKLLMREQIKGRKIINPLESRVEIFLKQAPALKVLEAMTRHVDKEKYYVGIPQFKAVGVSLHGNLIGLLSHRESNKRFFYSAVAGFYKCQGKQPHYYYPPTPPACYRDGTPLVPA